MEINLSDALPGFKKFNAFFADLKGDFEPAQLTDKEKGTFLKAISSIDGASKIEFLEFREDFELTAKVREARRYADGRTFVRFEFRRLEERAASCASDDCPSEFVWTNPCQLMAVFDSADSLDSYTVLPDRDDMPDGLAFAVQSIEPGPLYYEDTDDIAYVLDQLKIGYGRREVIIYNKATHEGLANLHYYVKSHYGLMYWRIGCIPWYMSASNMTLAQVEASLAALGTGGIRALEDAIEWRVPVYEESTVRVDEMLRRSLERAKLQGDAFGERTVRAVVVDEHSTGLPFRFLDIASGTLGEMRERIFEKAISLASKLKKVKLFAMLALRGHMKSQNNLGYHFHFGIGVSADYDLAIHWYTLAANAGDACAMTNLGKIFTEKDGPKWDGPKGIEWFEKAVAKGETWAMGELGHCLLCGKCAGKDVPRARSLLEKAVAANPDRHDFAENLERARLG